MHTDTAEHNNALVEWKRAVCARDKAFDEYHAALATWRLHHLSPETEAAASAAYRRYATANDAANAAWVQAGYPALKPTTW